MTSKEWFMFILTFVTGVFIGFYVYVTFFKPTFDPDDLTSGEQTASEFSVVGKQYGGSKGPEFIHPSFRLLANGSYIYVPGGAGENALQQETGKLPSSFVKELRKLMSVRELERLSQRVMKEDCRLYEGGVEYLYRVTLEGEIYELDTCGTVVTHDEQLAMILSQIWDGLDEPDSVGGLRGDGPYQWLENFLSDQFKWQENSN